MEEGPGNRVGTIGTPDREQSVPKPVVGENALRLELEEGL